MDVTVEGETPNRRWTVTLAASVSGERLLAERLEAIFMQGGELSAFLQVRRKEVNWTQARMWWVFTLAERSVAGSSSKGLLQEALKALR